MQQLACQRVEVGFIAHGRAEGRQHLGGVVLAPVEAAVDQGLPLPVHVGVSEGRVFAGQVGATFRRTYTILGDTAALAARLMARAGEDEIWVSAQAFSRGGGSFAATELEPFQVKGKADATVYGCHSGKELVAGKPLLLHDTCRGDSGGPLYIADKKGKWVLAGVTSRGTNLSTTMCGDGGTYTRVDKYAAWIKSTLKSA